MLNPLIFSFPRHHWHGCTWGSHGDSLLEAHHVISVSPGAWVGVAPCAGEELVWVPVLPLTPKDGWPWAVTAAVIAMSTQHGSGQPCEPEREGLHSHQDFPTKGPHHKKSLKEEHSGLPLHHPSVSLSGDSQGSASPHGPGVVHGVLRPEGGTCHGAWAGCRDTATSLQDPARGTRS